MDITRITRITSGFNAALEGTRVAIIFVRQTRETRDRRAKQTSGKRYKCVVEKETVFLFFLGIQIESEKGKPGP